uniref:Uncharacterized protein n=1 Tax=Medicago truncatula TaxID=3880 RepID=A2Q2A4_MEDTR|nr:hypothetical protein MtrDRAFT_AC149601g18v2 [Medicago truncatula]
MSLPRNSWDIKDTHTKLTFPLDADVAVEEAHECFPFCGRDRGSRRGEESHGVDPTRRRDEDHAIKRRHSRIFLKGEETAKQEEFSERAYLVSRGWRLALEEKQMYCFRVIFGRFGGYVGGVLMQAQGWFFRLHS